MTIALHIVYNSTCAKECLYKAVMWGGKNLSKMAVYIY